MRVLVIAPSYDLNTPGESWSTYKWVQGISASCETVVLTQHRRGWDQAKSPTAAAKVINWDEPKWPGMNGRIGWELKPGYIAFYYRARKWIKQALRRGEHFDLIHQINPLALRYPCPARNLGVKYIIGPLAGSLTTPEAFKATTPERQWYRKLRHLDTLRLRYDPWLKSSYAGAAAIIGVAPYVQALLSACAPRRFEIMAETGVEEVCPAPKSAPKAGEPLRLLFVGRLIRTKGILEAIESVAMAAKHCAITFDIVGTGDLAAECQKLVTRLGLGEIVRLHGRVSKEEVFRWYDRSDAFLFPSYREPSGNVVFEAMSRGLPVIGSSIGGPGYVITDACGYRVEPRATASI
ncbi:MAG: glycosyltransferase family 4 protein [Verrucomicrobia bacterium]|nr:glycosyltransferase family 4 protein [Verrucomicrobiota bacterium]